MTIIMFFVTMTDDHRHSGHSSCGAIYSYDGTNELKYLCMRGLGVSLLIERLKKRGADEWVT